MSDRVTTADLLARLQRHYLKPGPFPGGVFIPECGVNGGAQSRADALYAGFTSTSGRILVGHEIKASRADWRKELDSAGKADFWADNCHEWWIVAPGPDIVPKEEIPHGWGLMYPNPRTTTRMDRVVKPVTHADRVPSWDAVRSIMARLDTLREQHEGAIHNKAIKAAHAEAERLETERILRAEHDSLTPKQKRRLQMLDRIERIMGEPLSEHFDEGLNPDHVAATLRAVRAAGEMHENPRYAAQGLERSAEQLLKGLQEWADAMAALGELAGRRSA